MQPARRELTKIEGNAATSMPAPGQSSLPCSSSRQLHLFRLAVLHLELAAPAFDFEVVEDLADHAAQQALEVGVVDGLQAADGGILEAVRKHATGFLVLERDIEGLHVSMLRLFDTPGTWQANLPLFLVPGSKKVSSGFPASSCKHPP